MQFLYSIVLLLGMPSLIIFFRVFSALPSTRHGCRSAAFTRFKLSIAAFFAVKLDHLFTCVVFQIAVVKLRLNVTSKLGPEPAVICRYENTIGLVPSSGEAINR